MSKRKKPAVATPTIAVAPAAPEKAPETVVAPPTPQSPPGPPPLVPTKEEAPPVASAPAPRPPAPPWKPYTPPPPPPPPPPMKIGDERAAKIMGIGLRWYVVALKEQGWPAIPVLAFRGDVGDSIGAYMAHCGLHDSTAFERFSVRDAGEVVVVMVEEDLLEFVNLPPLDPRDEGKCGGVSYLIAAEGEIDG